MRDLAPLDQVRQRLRRALPELRDTYGVGRLAIFGSVARGDAAPESDVDILVEFQRDPPTLFGMLRLERMLSELLGRRVDLVMESALKPRLRAQILAEAVAA